MGAALLWRQSTVHSGPAPVLRVIGSAGEYHHTIIMASDPQKIREEDRQTDSQTNTPTIADRHMCEHVFHIYIDLSGPVDQCGWKFDKFQKT